MFQTFLQNPTFLKSNMGIWKKCIENIYNLVFAYIFDLSRKSYFDRCDSEIIFDLHGFFKLKPCRKSSLFWPNTIQRIYIFQSVTKALTANRDIDILKFGGEASKRKTNDQNSWSFKKKNYYYV